MKLLTKEIEKSLPKLLGTEKIPLNEKIAVCKFFTPDASWTWYAVEGNKEDDDFIFFGLVDSGYDKEWGYFSLNELLSVKGALGLPIERDLHFENVKISKILEEEL